EPLEALARPVGNQQRGGIGTVVDAYAVGGHEMFVALAAATEPAFELALGAVNEDILLAIPIGHVDVAVGCHGGFGGHERFRFVVQSRLEGGIQRPHHLAIRGGFIHLVFGGIGDEQEFIAPLPGQREAVRPGEIVAPAGKQLAAGIVYQYVVVRFVGEQQEAPAAILHHFVAVVYGIFAVIQHAPAFYLFIGHAIVAIDGFRRTEGAERRRGSQYGG